MTVWQSTNVVSHFMNIHDWLCAHHTNENESGAGLHKSKKVTHLYEIMTILFMNVSSFMNSVS